MTSTALRLCTASSCRSRGSEAIRARLEQVAAASGGQVRVTGVGCLGPCSDGPLLAMGQRLFSLEAPHPEPLARSLQQAVEQHRVDTWRPPGGPLIPADDAFMRLQRRLVLERCGAIDPECLEAALAHGSYQQLQQLLTQSSPAAVIDAVRRSGLRGRGGAGYPTGLKWAAVAAMAGDNKLVVCNADEGDPGAFMDRTVMEGDPHRLLEGMAIAAFAIGAQRGYIYVRADYPLAIARLRRAIEAAQARGWLGSAMAGTPFRFEVEIRVGAGAYVCGEETALIRSIEGGRGVPRPRPPYPAERGAFGLPTLINNVETLANVPVLLRLGPDAYRPGTKVFSLTGHVRRGGVLEVPMGTSLRTIVEEMGGGAPAGRSIKAVQTGGPSGGCVPASHLDTPVDYESLQALGSTMGSGGMVVLDDTTDMVDLAAFFMAFCRDESCGTCVPCRCGTVQLEQFLRKLLAQQATRSDLEQLEGLCHTVQQASLCGLGQNAPNPVLSVLRHFRSELEQRLP